MALLSLLSGLLLLIPVSTFVPTPLGPTYFQTQRFQRPHHGAAAASPSSSSLNLVPAITSSAAAATDQFISLGNSILLSTVDADIANLSDNEFAPIFAGGILVMFGGLLSAIIVGTIVEKKDLYASIVAESYAQGADDSEFWKGLSEEEKKKTQELLKKIKDNNNGETQAASSEAKELVAPPSASSPLRTSTSAAPRPASGAAKTTNEKTPQEVDMFSDY